jgi:ABC-type nitrate/sulfonate/bicarbonate transport system substrate-binding protein
MFCRCFAASIKNIIPASDGGSSMIRRRARTGVSPISAVAAVVVVAIVVGAGGYYVGSSAVGTATITSTATVSVTSPPQTVTRTSSAATNLTQFTAYGGGVTQTAERLLVDTAKAQGFFSNSSLAPQWLQSSPTSNFANYPSLIGVASVGIGPMSDALLAEANGAPIQIVGAFAGAPASITFFAVSNSSIKSGADLAGKTVGVVASTTTSANWLMGPYYAKRMGINFTMVLEGNATNAVKALTTGKTDAMLGGVSPLMPAGNVVTVVDPNSVWVTPFAGQAIWATKSILQSNPTLVKAFVKSVLATANFLSQNPTYAANLYVADFTGSPNIVLPAATTVANLNFAPSGTFGTASLVIGATNAWQFYSGMCTGTCTPGSFSVVSAVDTSFLP